MKLQQQIDACCDQFEQALQNGDSLDASQLIESVPEQGQLLLRRELAAIEIAYQRTQDCRDSEGLHLRCPHCQNQVELLPEAKLEEITCNSCGDTFSLIEDDESTRGDGGPRRVGHFELITRLGTGGFGSVWEARDTALDRLVALKLPRKSQLSAREAEQFFREARTAAQLRHPHIVPVHEVGKEDGTIFIVTDLIRGVTLSDWLKEVRPSASETASLCKTVAEALAYAHQQGVIHRDLKPSNVMLDENHQPHIMDFGLAKRELGEITMTVDGTVLGTPAYMSPEQAQGQLHWVDRRTDVYSLGVMLFQMLTGELPYRGTAQQQIQQRIVDDAPDPRKLNAHVPADLATICLKCLERDAGRRYSTAAEVAAELQRFLTGEPIKSRPISSFSRAMRWAKRKPALATASTLTTVLAIAGPLAAYRIAADRQTIAAQLVERDKALARRIREYEGLEQQLESSQSLLESILEAHPGIAELSDWHKHLIESFIQSNQVARAELLVQPPSTIIAELENQARSHLAWAYLYTAIEQPEQTATHAAAARDMLQTLINEQTGQFGLSVLLAQSLQQLSTAQQSLGKSAEAAKSANEALTIRTSLAEMHPDELKYALDQFFATNMKLGVMLPDGIDSGKKQAVADLATLKNSIQKKLTVEPEKFYALACYLTQHEAYSGDDLAPVPTGQVFEQDEVD